MDYQSQYGQDEALYRLLFKNKMDGVFVELGAGDGVRLSNTYFFEKQGWSGICIEPNPFEYKKLIENRHCITENIVIATNPSPVEFLAIDGEGKGLSGIVDEYDSRHLQRIETSGEVKGRQEVMKVPTSTMENLFDKHNITEVDYFSLDVEGSELDVLHSINFEKVKINYFTIENNYNSFDEAIFLMSKGFIKIGTVKIDDVYRYFG